MTKKKRTNEQTELPVSGTTTYVNCLLHMQDTEHEEQKEEKEEEKNVSV